jgi:hypothetical protein
METKSIILRIGETQSWFLKKINEVKQTLKWTISNKISDEKGVFTINTNEIQKITREYFKNFTLINWNI